MELFLFATVLICLIIASYTDILTREVPDYLSHGLLMVTIAFILIISIYNETYAKLIFALIGLIITLIIGLSLYYLNQWGGADAKILFSLGLTFGYIGLDYLTILLVLMVFVGALYSLIWGIIYFCKQWKKAIKQFKKILSQQKGFRIVNLCLSIITIVALFLPIKYGLKFLLIIFTLFFIFTYYLFIFTKTVESLNMINRRRLVSKTCIKF